MQPVTLDLPETDRIAERRAHLQKLLRSHGRGRFVFAGLGLLSPLAFKFGYGAMIGIFTFCALNAVASALKYRALQKRLRELEALANEHVRRIGIAQ